MKKYVTVILFLSLLFSCIGCGTMMVLFGDNVRYSITGNVHGGNDEGSISDVLVSLDCAGIEKSLYQESNSKTDINGNYEMAGNWELNGCQITFEHVDYHTLSISIDKSHLITAEGLFRTYKVDVQMKAKNEN